MAKIIEIEKSENGDSYQIDFENGMVLWFDTYTDSNGEIAGEWNKYIFFHGNEQDMKEQAFQDASNDEAGAYNYATALETIEDYLLNN